MGKKVFYLNYKGVRKEILQSPEMQQAIAKAAAEVAANASGMSGKNYSFSVQKGAQRHWGIIFPVDIKAAVDNAKRNTLVKALRSTKV